VDTVALNEDLHIRLAKMEEKNKKLAKD